MRIFKKPVQGASKKKKDMPEGLWKKCNGCSQSLFHKALEDNGNVCPKCNYHFPLTSLERIKLLADDGSFSELYKDMSSLDPLEFVGSKPYPEKLADEQKDTGLTDAVLVGDAVIDGNPCVLAVTDYRFMMGSMGSVLGEKVTRAIERGIEKKLPVVIVSTSGGGARMQEGMLSLMQMAKTSGALEKLKEAGKPFISVLAHPTMGGVMASFAGLGDVTIAEPGALIGFAGPRVIKQTIKQDLPKGFQTSEFNLDHGMIDMVVERKDLKAVVAKLITYLA
jgi:acetyl-CoA carboxylase carboxyl transferase subunit beta